MTDSTGLRVNLNQADRDLDFNIGENGLQGSSLYEKEFAYCWSGARANIGITAEKYCFGCKITSIQPVPLPDTDSETYSCCIGVSGDGDVFGDMNTSCTFSMFDDGDNENFDNGMKFVTGDTIVCAVDFTNKPFASISFFKNETLMLGTKHFHVIVDGLFPHILLKNIVVQMQFTVYDGLIPQKGFKPWGASILDKNYTLGPKLSEIDKCEVILMVGLPSSGKTTWAKNWMKEHPEKRYVHICEDTVLDKMKVPGNLRNYNHGEQFQKWMNRARMVIIVLLSRARKIPRNFILDTHEITVNSHFREDRLSPFRRHIIKNAVVVFPKPEDLDTRSKKRFQETGKKVSADMMEDMIVRYELPRTKDMGLKCDLFDQVLFSELNREESQRCLDEMRGDISSKVGRLSAYTMRLADDQGLPGRIIYLPYHPSVKPFPDLEKNKPKVSGWLCGVRKEWSHFLPFQWLKEFGKHLS